MLESEMKKLTAAVEANTAALLGGAAPVAAAPAAAAPAADAAVSAEQVLAAANTPAASTAIDMSTELAPPAAEAAAEVVAAPANLKMITETIVELAKAKGREAARTLLAEYGAASVPELKKHADKYDEILAKMKALIAAK